MTKWEYMAIKGGDYRDHITGVIKQNVLNNLGMQGWELVCYDHLSSSLIFKRPKS